MTLLCVTHRPGPVKVGVHCLLVSLAACSLVLLLGVLLDRRILFVALGIVVASLLISWLVCLCFRHHHPSVSAELTLVRNSDAIHFQKLRGKLSKLHGEFASLLPQVAEDSALARRLQTTVVEINDTLHRVSTWNTGGLSHNQEEEQAVWQKVAQWKQDLREIRATYHLEPSDTPVATPDVHGVLNTQGMKPCSAMILVPPPYEKEPPRYELVEESEICRVHLPTVDSCTLHDNTRGTAQPVADFPQVSLVTEPAGPPPLYSQSC